MPDLEAHINTILPGHQELFHQTLTDFGLDNWLVVFAPSPNMFSKGGCIVHGIKMIVIANHLDVKEIIVTLLHEILHFLDHKLEKHWSEDTIDALAYQWYEDDHYKWIGKIKI